MLPPAARPPLRLDGDPRRTLRRDPGVPAGRRRRRRPRRRRPGRGPGGATQAARARRLVDQRRAAAGQAGRPAAARGRRRCSRRGSARCPGSRAWTSPGPGFLNIVLDAAAAGELARTIVEAGAGYGRTDARRRPPGQPGVRLGQPDRAAAPGRHPLGRRRRQPRPDPAGHRRRGRPGVLLQRPRRPDRPVRPLAARPGHAASRRPRTATAAQYIDDIAARVLADAAAAGEPDPLTLPDDRGAGGLPRAAVST